MPDTLAACIALLEEINAAAEADMLAGNPITGAHHRAIEKRLAELRAERDGDDTMYDRGPVPPAVVEAFRRQLAAMKPTPAGARQSIYSEQELDAF